MTHGKSVNVAAQEPAVQTRLGDASLAAATPIPLEPVAPQDFKAWLQSACDAVEEALLDHRLSEWVCEDDETSNFPLLDHLSHDKDTGSGRREIEMLAETVFFALERHGPFAAPISPPSLDAVDAARYRWIRHNHAHIKYLGKQPFYVNWYGTSEGLDTAIDAALREPK